MSSIFYFWVSYLIFNWPFFYIIWDNRKRKYDGGGCTISVDGTDFRIQRQKGSYKHWYGYKFKKPGDRYEVGVSIKGGDIVWINAPFACGSKNDIQIFRHSLKNFLEEGERVEADDGYIGEAPKYMLYQKAIRSIKVTREREQLAQRIRNRQETVNKRFKQFNCLNGTFRHRVQCHSMCFRAIVVLTQICIQKGEALFKV